VTRAAIEKGIVPGRGGARLRAGNWHESGGGSNLGQR
jgi:hypothetical protein